MFRDSPAYEAAVVDALLCWLQRLLGIAAAGDAAIERDLQARELRRCACRIAFSGCSS